MKNKRKNKLVLSNDFYINDRKKEGEKVNTLFNKKSGTNKELACYTEKKVSLLEKGIDKINDDFERSKYYSKIIRKKLHFLFRKLK